MYLFCDTKCRAAEVQLQVQVVLGVEICLESQEPSHQTAPGGWGNAFLQATADRSRVPLLFQPSLKATKVSRIKLLKLPDLLQTMKEIVPAQKEQKYGGIKLWRCLTCIGRETAEMRMVPAPPNGEHQSNPVNNTRHVRGPAFRGHPTSRSQASATSTTQAGTPGEMVGTSSIWPNSGGGRGVAQTPRVSSFMRRKSLSC